MIILNIETSTSVCSTAITENGTCLMQKINTEGLNHAKLLSLFIEELLSFLKKENKTLDAVALSQGPGSYTGLRIGTATAKGLCYGLDIPLIAVDTLQLMAVSALNHIAATENFSLRPMIDARRMEVYTGLYDQSLKQLIPVQAAIINENSFAEELAKNDIYFFGNGADKCSKIITNPRAHFLEGIYPNAAEMAPLAEKALSEKHFSDLAYFEPFYLKEFQATVSKKHLF